MEKSPTSCHDDITDCGVFVATMSSNLRVKPDTVLDARISSDVASGVPVAVRLYM